MASTKSFDINASDFEEFRFQLPRRTRIRLLMIATEPVSVFIFDSKQMHDYERGKLQSFHSTEGWRRRSELDERLYLDEGTWHLVIEGYSYRSKGKIQISP